ncbi:MAG: hypothetical protein WAS24_09650, partial [Thermoplasmata archaeon]
VIGGYLAYFFLDFYSHNAATYSHTDWILGLGAVYAISAFGRAACAVWFFKLKDPVKYPDTLTGVIRKALKRWREGRWTPD